MANSVTARSCRPPRIKKLFLPRDEFEQSDSSDDDDDGGRQGQHKTVRTGLTWMSQNYVSFSKDKRMSEASFKLFC